MDQRFALISALTMKNPVSPLLVRATRIWESINKKTNQVFHTNVLLLDQEGNQIVAMVRNTQKANCFPLLGEGKVYQISNAKVVGASRTFRAVDRNISLLIYHGTRIEPAEDTGLIPKNKFELTTLEDVARLVNATSSLIDVFGLITAYGALERAANGAQKLDLTLTNEREKKLNLTLWEDKAHQFLEAFQVIQGVPVFAVVSGLLAKTFAGTPTLSSTDATKCYLNIDYDPLTQLRDAIVAATGKTVDLIPPPTNQRSVAANASSLQKLTISEILGYHLPAGEKVARCLCLAEIEAVIASEGWYYNCCPKCARKVRLLGQSYYCDNCAENVPELKQRYKLIVRVRDPSGTTTFTIFNKDVDRLVHVPVEKLIGELGQAQDTPAAQIPAVLNNVVGNTCVFDVKINPYNTNLGYEEYTVVKLSEYAPGDDEDADQDGEDGGQVAEHGGAAGKRQRIA